MRHCAPQSFPAAAVCKAERKGVLPRHGRSSLSFILLCARRFSWRWARGVPSFRQGPPPQASPSAGERAWALRLPFPGAAFPCPPRRPWSRRSGERPLARAIRTWCPADASSIMARRPRAPLLRAMALCGDGAQRVVLKNKLHAVQIHQLFILLHQRVARLGKDASSALPHPAASSVTVTGKRPTNSGIRPNFIRSSGRIWRSTSPTFLFFSACAIRAEAHAPFYRSAARSSEPGRRKRRRR